MINPYDVIGVSPDADENEVKSAYKRLAMRYHPDIFEGEQAELAIEKMKELDEAYDVLIQKLRMSAPNTKSNKEKNSSNTVSEYEDVRRLILAGRLDDAEEILDGVSKSSRNSEWNYLKGFILYKRGWLDEATNYVSKAYEQDPYNEEYSELYNELTGSKTGAFGGYFPGILGGCSPCSMCISLLCCDMCCGCLRR